VNLSEVHERKCILPSHPHSYMVREDVDFTSKQVLTEDTSILTPFNANELLKFVTEKSDNVQSLAESVGFDLNNSSTSFNKKDQMLSLKEGNETLKVFLESSLKAELNNFYNTL
jgi:hypothetical protein